MCGINGIIRFDGMPVAGDMLQAMNTAVCHRGPDDHGVFLHGHVGLGHLRLAVIDLSSNGHQPMCYTHGGRTAVMIYNGEVYNFAELRDELEGKGYAFRSRSDTEVMLAAYLEFGVDCVTRFNGMFAFVIYDLERNILFGARDRFGEKPFKYYLDDERMVFSSELKALFAAGVQRELDLDAVDDFLTLQYVPQPRTGFQKIRKLPHAHYFVLDIASRSMQITRYFDLDYSKKLEAARARLARSDRRGVASRRGAAADRRCAARRFSVGRPRQQHGRCGHASVHDRHPIVLGLVCRERLRRVTVRPAGRRPVRHDAHRVPRQRGRPARERRPARLSVRGALRRQLATGTFLLARLTREHVTVALSGDAGDENFGGYDKHRMHVLVDRWRPLLQPMRTLAPALDGARSAASSCIASRSSSAR